MARTRPGRCVSVCVATIVDAGIVVPPASDTDPVSSPRSVCANSANGHSHSARSTKAGYRAATVRERAMREILGSLI